MNTGHIDATLPIGGWADDVVVDHKRQRIYVITGVGYVETVAIGGKNDYRLLPKVATGLLAKTGDYSEALDRLYVSVPTLGQAAARILVMKPVP